MHPILKLSALAISLSISAAANADALVLFPGATVLSGPNQWVTVDAAVVPDVFHFDHRALPLTGLTITGPDGSAVQPQNSSTGQQRSTFDARLVQPGTYEFTLPNNFLLAAFKVDGNTRRMRTSAETLAKDIPANATDVELTQIQNRIETFVTTGKPSKQPLKTVGDGLELVPITHPNDLVAGEAASFRLLLDGKPAADLAVKATPGGARYRNNPGDIALKTDADGKFSITWPAAGMYYVEAQVRDNKTSVPNARERRAGYSVTLEVLPK